MIFNPFFDRKIEKCNFETSKWIEKCNFDLEKWIEKCNFSLESSYLLLHLPLHHAP